MKKPLFSFLLLFFFWVVFPKNLWAKISIPDIFSEHMVLQRDMPIPVWGTAKGTAFIEVMLNQKKVITSADYFGNWKLSLPAMKAGGPYKLIIQSKEDTIELADVYIGEVWLCSGQSNMEWTLGQSAEGKAEIPKTNNSLIRFFHLKKKHNTYHTPYSKEEVKAFNAGQFFHQTKWEHCTSETAAAFSGVAYFFAKELYDSLKVPIGLIQAAVGGSPAQSWISKEAIASHPQLKHLVDENRIWLNSPIIHPWLAVRAKENWRNWEKEERGLPGHPFAPTYLYDYAIKPLAPYSLRGVIWYQGESNATHPESYPAMQELLIKCWRDLWGQGEFPFYYVQLPKIGNRSLWPEFREAQQQSLSVPNTGMIVTLDQGHPTDVHPTEKEVIGQRLARLALAKTYHKDIFAESPNLDVYHWQPAERKIILHFENTYDGLRVREGVEPKGIFLQGYKAQGTLEVNTLPEKIMYSKSEITITYPIGFLPVKIKYAWAPHPENNFVNSVGLPLAPFKIELEGSN